MVLIIGHKTIEDFEEFDTFVLLETPAVDAYNDSHPHRGDDARFGGRLQRVCPLWLKRHRKRTPGPYR